MTSRSFTAAVMNEAIGRADLLFLDPLPSPILMGSSPHVVPFTWLRRELCWSERRQDLVDGFAAQLEKLDALGVHPVCAIVGGSMITAKHEPGDLDALVVYRSAPGPLSDAAVAAMRRGNGPIDLRYVPDDMGALGLLKMGCFFHSLYSNTDDGVRRPGVGERRPSVLVALTTETEEKAWAGPAIAGKGNDA